MGKVLLAVAVLVVTNLATFGFATWRCRQEMEGQQRLLATAQEKSQATEAEMARVQQQLGQLRVWGELIELQQDVNAAHATINRLNFGDALQIVDRVQRRLDSGEYGQLFRQRRAELVPHLDLARQALRRADATAHGHLVDLDQRAFQILAQTSSSGTFPGRPAAVEPTPSPAPSPGFDLGAPSPSPAPFPTAPASPAPSPSPTASPRGNV
jgi:hypothetical protein